jgi:hypothetical protein
MKRYRALTNTTTTRPAMALDSAAGNRQHVQHRAPARGTKRGAQGVPMPPDGGEAAKFFNTENKEESC